MMQYDNKPPVLTAQITLGRAKSRNVSQENERNNSYKKVNQIDKSDINK